MKQYDGWKITIEAFPGTWTMYPWRFDMRASADNYVSEVKRIFAEECSGLEVELDVNHDRNGPLHPPVVTPPADPQEDLEDEIHRLWSIISNEVAMEADGWMVELDDWNKVPRPW